MNIHSGHPTFERRLEQAMRICRSRAGTANRESTRTLCNCIEQPDGEQLIAELVRRAHTSPKLNEGVRLLFSLSHINETAKRFGVKPLPVLM